MDGWMNGVGGVIDQLRYGLLPGTDNQLEMGRIVVVGLAGAGKRTLLNTLWGMSVIPATNQIDPDGLDSYPSAYRDYGLFRVIELPAEDGIGESVSYAVEDAGLIVYVLDGVRGLTPADFGWVARLRVGRAPLLIVLNKRDRVSEALPGLLAQIESRLALTALSLCACDSEDVHGAFLKAILRAAPELSTGLAAQIPSLRHSTAQRIIRQSTALSMAAAVEPIPLVDVTVLIGLQVHLVSRIAALYGRKLAGQAHWEIVMTVAFGLLLRGLAQPLLKFIPWGGWLASSIIGASGTYAVGQAAVAYYEGLLMRTGERVRDGMAKHRRRALARVSTVKTGKRG